MLDAHLIDRAGLVAHRAGEGDDGADVAAPLRKPRDLGADVEVLVLDPDHVSPR